MADDWAALAACTVIAAHGIAIWRRALHDVLDGSVDSELIQAIDACASGTPGVVSTEKCRVRKSGIHLLVDIHVRVHSQMTVFEGHRISHDVKNRLMAKHPRISEVTIHIEPADPEKRAQ